jgi:hypothetical protein
LKRQSISIEKIATATRVTVPMQFPYSPIPPMIRGLDVFVSFFAVVWFVCSTAVRSLLHIPPAPRAIFEIDASRFKMILCAQDSAATIAYDWPRSAIVEIRKNRFDKGLWIHAQGFAMDTYLEDLPADCIESLSRVLQELVAESGQEKNV